MTSHKRCSMSPSPIHKCQKIVCMKIVDNSLLVVAVLLTIAAILLVATRLELEYNESTHRIHHFIPHPLILSTVLFLVILVTVYCIQRPRMVYLIDYACFSTTHNYRVASASFVEYVRQINQFSERSIRFLTRLLERSGLGEETSCPATFHYIKPYKYCTLEAAREEAQLVVFSAIDDLFAKTNIVPITIDLVVVNCSGFCPTPGFPDMIMNKYKMRSDIRNVHLSGMGCSAGLISIEVAKNLLQAMPRGARALVVSTETLTPNYYFGNERAMLLPLCLFRMGGAAMLRLSTSSTKARFRLKHIMRTLTAADDKSYQCIHQKEDDKGNTGVDLSVDLMVVAATTLKANITAIASQILPFSEKLAFVLSFISQKFLKTRIKLYVPNFLKAFEHICIHAGGRAVIDEIQRSLSLPDEHVEASRMTLHGFGNISSSSLWYEMAYIEAKRCIHKGDRIWMIGFGSGFKCNSAVW